MVIRCRRAPSAAWGRSASAVRTSASSVSPWPIASIGFASDGRVLAVGVAKNDLRVQIWDSSRGGMIRPLPDQDDRIWHFAWSPDGKSLAIGASRYQVQLHDVESGALRRSW